MLDDLLIGGMAGVISRTATAPLELYKIQRQNQYLKEASIKTVLKKEGIRYLWKGNMTNCLRVFPQIATNFTAFENCKKHIFNNPPIRIISSIVYFAMILTSVYQFLKC